MNVSSLYNQIIKNESRKINVMTGVCCDFENCESNENIKFLKNILIDNGSCGDKKHKKYNCKNKHNIENTPTNIYRFKNQNFLDNYFGRSNINVTYINNAIIEKQAQIERILEKYSRKCKKCR